MRDHTNRMSVTEICMLRLMSGKTHKDKNRNETMRENLGSAPMKDKIRKRRNMEFGWDLGGTYSLINNFPPKFQLFYSVSTNSLQISASSISH